MIRQRRRKKNKPIENTPCWMMQLLFMFYFMRVPQNYVHENKKMHLHLKKLHSIINAGIKRDGPLLRNVLRTSEVKEKKDERNY